MSQTVETTTRVFKQVGSNSADGKPIRFIRPGELAESGTTGLILEGIYLGPVANEMTGKDDYKFETDDELVVINGNGSLRYKLNLINVGDLVQISYLGKEKLTKGAKAGKSAHSFNVAVAE